MILLTGATGFVGSAIVPKIDSKQLVVFGRSKPPDLQSAFARGSIDTTTDFREALKGINTVIHTAARVHTMHETARDPLSEYRAVNCAGTMRLATQAAELDVKRFIFLSTVKVMGEYTLPGSPFNEQSPLVATDPYSISKAEAELQLRELSERRGMEVVIIRPPLVYGPGVKANFASMLKLAQMNLPWPLGAIENKRSLIALDNLVDLILTCVDHPNARNRTFLASDDEDLSTSELLVHMIRAYGKRPRLLPFPTRLLRLCGSLLGKDEVLKRLLCNLQVDIEYTKNTLNWSPPVSVSTGIRQCIQSAA